VRVSECKCVSACESESERERVRAHFDKIERTNKGARVFKRCPIRFSAEVGVANE